MTEHRLDEQEAEELLAGRQPVDRADLAAVAEVAAVLHASRELEPPPPMSSTLAAQLALGVPRRPPARARHRPRHLAAAPSRGVVRRRTLVSLSVAAGLVVGLVLVSSRHGVTQHVDSMVGDLGAAVGFEEGSANRSTTTTDPPAPPQTTTAPPTTAPPTTPPPAPATPETTASDEGRDDQGVDTSRADWFASLLDWYLERYGDDYQRHGGGWGDGTWPSDATAGPSGDGGPSTISSEPASSTTSSGAATSTSSSSSSSSSTSR